jgi:hypothetical protein
MSRIFIAAALILEVSGCQSTNGFNFDPSAGLAVVNGMNDAIAGSSYSTGMIGNQSFGINTFGN